MYGSVGRKRAAEIAMGGGARVLSNTYSSFGGISCGFDILEYDFCRDTLDPYVDFSKLLYAGAGAAVGVGFFAAEEDELWLLGADHEFDVVVGAEVMGKG